MSHIKTVLFKSKILKNGQHPVMLYIFEGQKRYYLSLSYTAFTHEFNEKKGRFKKNYPNAKAKNLNIHKYELRANEIIDDFVREGKEFDYPKFKQLFKGELQTKTFYQFFEEMIKEKKSLGKIGTMRTYKDAYNTIKKYHPKDFNFHHFNYTLLKGLETSLFARGNTGGGISVRMRAIRAIYYEAIRRGFANKQLNPYSTSTNKDGYSVSKLRSKRNPKSLTVGELQKFKDFDLGKHPELADTWRYFMFSFQMFGINFIDICHLQTADLVNGRLHYTRQKTGKPFDLLVTNKALEIVEHLRTGRQYLFPIFDEAVHISPTQKKNRSQKVLRKVNKDLKTIAHIQGIQTHMTFYTARHTSATTLKRNGIATDIISEALGHQDLNTTQIYLSKFDNEVLDNAIINL